MSERRQHGNRPDACYGQGSAARRRANIQDSDRFWSSHGSIATEVWPFCSRARPSNSLSSPNSILCRTSTGSDTSSSTNVQFNGGSVADADGVGDARRLSLRGDVIVSTEDATLGAMDASSLSLPPTLPRDVSTAANATVFSLPPPLPPFNCLVGLFERIHSIWHICRIVRRRTAAAGAASRVSFQSSCGVRKFVEYCQSECVVQLERQQQYSCSDKSPKDRSQSTLTLPASSEKAGGSVGTNNLAENPSSALEEDSEA